MESDFEDRNGRAGSARDALDAIGADRERLADGVAAQSRWTVPAQALAVAAMVASPAAGVGFASVITAAAVIGLFAVNAAVRKRTGVSVTRPAGPRGTAIAIGLGAVMITLYTLSMVLFFSGNGGGIALTTVSAFVLMLLGGLLYDRVYAQEVRRAG